MWLAMQSPTEMLFLGCGISFLAVEANSCSLGTSFLLGTWALSVPTLRNHSHLKHVSRIFFLGWEAGTTPPGNQFKYAHV